MLKLGGNWPLQSHEEYVIEILYRVVVTEIKKSLFYSLVRNPNRDYCESPFNMRVVEWKPNVGVDISTSTPQKQTSDKGKTSQSVRKEPKKTGEDLKDMESGTPRKGNKKVVPKTPNGPTLLDKWVRKETRCDQESKPVDTTEPKVTFDDTKLFIPKKSRRTSQISPTLERTVLSTSPGRHFEILLFNRTI